MGYRLTVENPQYHQYHLRMIKQNEPYKLMKTSKIMNPPYHSDEIILNQNKNVYEIPNNKKKSYPELTGKGRFVNEYI
ncbi:hypothetical protein [Heyndrickxia oleronia]|uniref:Uncharacterized protein n=1 Tax=Heyndrickxia oleronia TaxID=38875 RepID=A0AAW6SVM0_9BACI|nr:hypothetical protein [Heyndrickxia oleronia]MDH5160932.1 hypothetical protein [Heyndrickxia oleronia]